MKNEHHQRWFKIESHSLSDSLRPEVVKDSADRCPRCGESYVNGVPVNVILKSSRRDFHYLVSSNAAVLSVALCRWLVSRSSRPRVSLGRVLRKSGEVDTGYVTAVSIDRLRYLRKMKDLGGRYREVLNCSTCNRRFNLAGSNTGMPENCLDDDGWFFGDSRELFLRQDCLENLKSEEGIDLGRFVRPIPICASAKDGIDDNELYPNPEIRLRPDGEKVFYRYNGWVPLDVDWHSLEQRNKEMLERKTLSEVKQPNLEIPEITGNVCIVVQRGDDLKQKVEVQNLLGRPGSSLAISHLVKLTKNTEIKNQLSLIWSRFDGCTLYQGAGSDGLLTLWTAENTRRHLLKSLVPDSNQVKCRYVIEVGEVPASGVKICIMADGADAGKVALVDEVHGEGSCIADSLIELIQQAVLNPSECAEVLGSYYRAGKNGEQYLMVSRG